MISGNEAAPLAKLTNASANQDDAIANPKIVNRQEDFMGSLVDVEVRDVTHLSRVIAGLRATAASNASSAPRRSLSRPRLIPATAPTAG